MIENKEISYTNDEDNCLNIDNYIDNLDYFKPRMYITGNIKLDSFNISDKEIKIKFLRAFCKSKSPEIFAIFEHKIGIDEVFTNSLMAMLNPKIILEKPIISFKPNESKFNRSSFEILPLQMLEQNILNDFNKRLLGYMTTITLPVEFSFHDSWYLIEKIRDVSLNIIKKYSLMSVSTIEYMTKGNDNYLIKKAKQIEWYKNIVLETDKVKQIKMLDPTGTKLNDFGFTTLIGTKLPYLYYPCGTDKISNLSMLISFFKIIRKRFGYIPDSGHKRVKTKDNYRSYYDNEFNTTILKFDQIQKRDIEVPYFTPYFCGVLNTTSRKDLLRSLFNYFNVVLFNTKSRGSEGEFFDTSMIEFCQTHYSRIRDIYNSTNETSINKILDEYFPIHTINEIGLLKGIFEIKRDELKLKVKKEEYDAFLRVENYYTYSENFTIEFTLFSFLAFQHIQNGLSNVGYPHIHIYFLTEALDRGPLNDIRREIDLNIKLATGLYGERSVLTELKNSESYINGIGYLMKNHSSQFVDKMLTQIDQHGDKIRNSKDPILYIDYYDDKLYELTSYVWYMILGAENEDGKISPWSFTRDYIPLKLRKNKNTDQIYRSILQEFYPESIPKIEILEQIELVENDIFDIKYTPTDYKNEKIQWIHYLQRYMVERKLVICDGNIYQKRKIGKYSFELYYPINDEGEICTIEGWDASISQFIKSFSNYQSPRAPSEKLQRELIEIFENTTPGYTSQKFHFPCIKLNFRLIEYDDFILDIINRCTYDIPPKGQYCYLNIMGINKSNMYNKIDEMLSTVSISMEDFIQDKLKRNILGLLKHLKMYNFHVLSMLHNFINVRFKKDELDLLIGDKNAYKSALTLLVYCVFPRNKVGLVTNFSSNDIGYNIAGKLAVINEEAGPCLEDLKSTTRPGLLNFAAASNVVGDKKFKDHKTFATANTSAIFAANIDSDTLKYITVPEIMARLNLNLHKPIEQNLDVVTVAEYQAILGELLIFICMVSLSKQYFECEKIPKLHHYENIPEPLERIHKYFNHGCDPIFLQKLGESNRSALDIRDFTFRSTITHEFFETEFHLPAIKSISKEEMINEIIRKAKVDKAKKLFETIKSRQEASYNSQQLLEQERREKEKLGIRLERHECYNPMST
jgi:hypothetical protein